MKNQLFSTWILTVAFACLPLYGSAQSSNTKPTATGTGNTTGHIANLTINNQGKTNINIPEMMVYIPSDGQYQPYITTIPPTSVPPGATVTIPLDGYCADVHTPPVGAGDGMPPIDTWITTVPPITPGSTSIPNPLGIKEVPSFTVTDIPGITGKPGFTSNPTTPTTPPCTIPECNPTWPGTDKPVGGTIDPGKNPETFGPVLIKALDDIARKYDELKAEGKITTPFSGDPVKEREAVIQQTFWIYTAGLSGEKYQKENFNDKVFKQFEDNSGVTVTTMPEPDKKKLQTGVDQFWSVFTAVGVEAKVINQPENDRPVPGPTLLGDTDKKTKGNCACDTMNISLALNIENRNETMISRGDRDQKAVFEKGKSTVELKKITASAPNVEIGKKVSLTVTPELKCTCSEKGAKCDNITKETVQIKHKKEVLKKDFGLDAVPYEIVVTISQTCGSDDCKEMVCSVEIPIKIEKETDKEKKRKAVEQKAADDAEKAKTKAEKEKEKKDE